MSESLRLSGRLARLFQAAHITPLLAIVLLLLAASFWSWQIWQYIHDPQFMHQPRWLHPEGGYQEDER